MDENKTFLVVFLVINVQSSGRVMSRKEIRRKITEKVAERKFF